jgi:hypothetical protein
VGCDIVNGINLASIANSLYVAAKATVINLGVQLFELLFLLPFAVNTPNDLPFTYYFKH